MKKCRDCEDFRVRYQLLKDGRDCFVLVDRWREQRKPKKYREACFWYREVQDMSMRIPVCEYKAEPPECYIDECPADCKTYLKREEAIKILREYAKGG